MKNLKQYFLFSILVFISFSFGLADNWVLIKKSDYQILFPLEPKEESETMVSAIGNLNMTYLTLSTTESETEKNLVYMIMQTDYPDSLVHSDFKDQLKSLFDNAVEGGVSNVKGKLIHQKDIEINGYPGREFSIDYNDGEAVMFIKTYLVKNRMYMLQTITNTGKYPNEDITKFMQSFKLMN